MDKRTEAFRKELKPICSRKDYQSNRQNIHTPWDLCHEMVSKLPLEVFTGKTFLTINLEYVEVLCYTFNVKRENVWFVTDCQEKAKVISHPRYAGVNVVCADYLNWSTNMKFDVIVGNPPYQIKSNADNRKTQPIWDKFVAKSLSLLKENGYLCYVHPAGWRNVDGAFKNTQELLLSKDIKHLEMYDKEQGFKTFGARTMYDWYVLQNRIYAHETTIKDQDGNFINVDLSKLPFMPNSGLDEITVLMAKNDEEKCEVLYSRSDYGTDKPNMSIEKKGIFKYPCIYMIRVNDEPVMWYSLTNDKGHFGIPKFIWGNGGYDMGSMIDNKGEYGLTQFAYAIIDEKENLPLIKKAFDSKKFKNVMKCCDGGNSNINRKVIALFRKDFWKQFVDESGNELK